MQKKPDETQVFTLENDSIDEASEYVQAYLVRQGTPGREITRCRLSVEEIMSAWQNVLGAEKECTVICRKRFSRISVILTAQGERADPYQGEENDANFAGGRNLLARLGLAAQFSYENGVNEVLLSPPGKPRNPILPVAAAVGLAIVAAGLLSILPAGLRGGISDNIVSPLFTTLLNLLSTIATPMIFLAVCSGIYSIGDIALLGKVGTKLVSRFIIMTFAVLIGLLLLIVWLFPMEFSTGGMANGAAALAIYQMLLDIVPQNMISPFIEGNALQVIFMGCACGIGALVLGTRVSGLAQIAEQFHSLVQLLMSAIGRLVPLFVFTCVLDLCISGGFERFNGVGKQLLLCLAAIILIVFGYAYAVSRKTRVSIPLLLKKLLPTFLVAVTTASSAAAFAINTETCKRKLGISEKLVDFGVPLGQVLYMPMGAIAFLLSALCIGQMYGVVITPMWLLVAVLVSGILAIATPPIPGGALSCYTILFLQLGIPTPGIALAISIDLVLDFLLTAINLYCLQTHLVLLAQDMDMLDTKQLCAK